MYPIRKISVTLLLIFTLALIVPVSAQDERPNIVTTTTQATDLINILAGDLVNLTGLMGAGVDPHLYQPTESDIAAMSQADAIFYSGLHLEGQFGEVFEALGGRGVLIYAVSEGVDYGGFTLEAVDNLGEPAAVTDPHFWFDPRNWIVTTEATAEQLALLDPENAEVYRENATAYVAQLETLYEWGVAAMETIPEEQRVLVTSHDAFQYFGDAFGWDVRGLQGISTEDEAGVGDVQALAAFVTERGIPVLFVESSVPTNTIEAVIEAISAEGGDVRLGERSLYSDAMGAPDEFGGTYIGMIAHNVITVLQSFGVEVPGWPEGLEPAPPDELLEAAS